MKKLSIVVPCHNEQATLPIFYKTVQKIVVKLPLQIEYWFIDDGSEDATLARIKELQEKNSNQVHFISFSRNFGKEAALYAGLTAATGDYVVNMDADLQDPPELLPKMYELIKTGEFDCIGTRRLDRKGESKVKSFLSNNFYRFINYVSKTKIVPGARDYRMMTRQMVNAVLSLKEYSRFSKGIFSWVGFRTKYLAYSNVKRVAGKSSWSTKGLFKYALSGISNFSLAPLNIAVWIGSISFVVSIISLIVVIIRHLINPSVDVFGWASLVSIILLIGGLQLLCIGIIGRYIGKIFLQVKSRPIYIIKEKK